MDYNIENEVFSNFILCTFLSSNLKLSTVFLHSITPLVNPTALPSATAVLSVHNTRLKMVMYCCNSIVSYLREIVSRLQKKRDPKKTLES